MKIPLIYNLRSVKQRPVSTALTALGIGLVVAVFVAMLALAAGFVAALVQTGATDNVTVAIGTNQLLGNDTDRMQRELRAILDGRGKSGRVPDLWDGHAGDRIAAALA